MFKQGIKCLGLILIVVLFISCNSEQVLEGYVVDSYKERPLPGMTVWVEEEQFTTNQYGAFKTSFNLDNVEVFIEGSERFHPFEDRVALFQRHNIRKFLLDARHPLDFPNQIYEPYSFIAHLYTPPGDERNISMKIKGISNDQSYIYQGSYIDSKGQKITQDMIQIGFNFWYRDDYGNWQYSELPPEKFPLWGMMMDQYIEIMYHYYLDLDFDYEILPDIQEIDDKKVKIIRIFPIDNAEFFNEMYLYTVTEGASQGMIKKAIIHSDHSKWFSPKIIISFDQVNVDLNIIPPSITY